eukprot:1148190-Pelagomonas_calceolata.AAC.4
MDEIMLDLRAITDKNIQYFQCNDFEAIYKSLEFNGARPTSLKQLQKVALYSLQKILLNCSAAQTPAQESKDEKLLLMLAFPGTTCCNKKFMIFPLVGNPGYSFPHKPAEVQRQRHAVLIARSLTSIQALTSKLAALNRSRRCASSPFAKTCAHAAGSQQLKCGRPVQHSMHTQQNCLSAFSSQLSQHLLYLYPHTGLLQ